MPARWFTDPAADAPAAIRPTFTQEEGRALVEILDFARDPANAEMELLQCLDAAGTCEHGRSTGRNAANFTPEMDAALVAGGGVRYWHNHPSRQSLSHFDWLHAGKCETVEVLALNVHGSIYVGRIVEWDDRLHELLPSFPELSGYLEIHLDGLAKTRGLSDLLWPALSYLTGHILNTALAKTMPVRYAFCLMNGDASTEQAANALEIIKDGIDFAESAIQDCLTKSG
jgi:hypothetical protein